MISSTLVTIDFVGLPTLLRIIERVAMETMHCHIAHTNLFRGRTGLVVRASDSGSGDPGSILGRVSVLFP